MWQARRWGGLAVLIALLGCGARGRDDGHQPQAPSQRATTCGAAIVAWADRCAAREHLSIPAVQCPEADLILVDLADSAALRVEVRRATPQSFRRVDAWGLSPVGNFADWSQVDARLRHDFDHLAACVGADQGFAANLGAAEPHAARPTRPHHREQVAARGGVIPWRLLGAVLCVLAVLRGSWRSGAWRRRAALAAALGVATFTLRALLLPARFFHQNGQGPLWVAELISPHHHPYGPGYREVFGWVSWFTHDPDRGVFFAQGALASLGPACALFIARRMGARRPLAWTLALAVAVDPILGRLSRSESYYGVGASLLFIAAALLAGALDALRVRREGFVLQAVAAALVIAQLARVHPLGWLAAALTPAVLLLGPGHWRRRVRRTLAATAIIALVVAVTAAPAMVAVLRSPFGAQWLGGGGRTTVGFTSFGGLWKALPIILLGVVVAVASARSWRRGALQGAVLLAAGAAALIADGVGSGTSTVWIHQAYLRFYAPVALVLLVAMSQRLMRDRRRGLAVAAAVTVAALAVTRAEWSAWTRMPTDAQEQELARQWRSELPTSGRVAYVDRVGRRISVLPFYANVPAVSPQPVLLRPDDFFENLALFGQEAFYERTSVCSTREGRDFCAQIEARYRMTPMHEAELAAVPSMVGLPYDGPTVRVGLYRVTGMGSP